MQYVAVSSNLLLDQFAMNLHNHTILHFYSFNFASSFFTVYQLFHLVLARSGYLLNLIFISIKNNQ
jgi:hypothetical protein